MQIIMSDYTLTSTLVPTVMMAFVTPEREKKKSGRKGHSTKDTVAVGGSG